MNAYRNVYRWVGMMALLVWAVGCASTQLPAENAYFLSAQQKGQLITHGTIQDAAGNWYDVRFVPGYQPAFERMTDYLGESGRDMAEYVSRGKYEAAGEAFRDIFEWSYKESFWRFGLAGSGKAWATNFHSASTSVKTRAFGWWLAYPVAFGASTLESVWRITWGTAGAAGGTLVGAMVPPYAAVDSTVKAAWHTGVDALAIPTVMGAWNTLVAPPLAVLGQKPSPERVDGWWISSSSAPSVTSAFRPGKEDLHLFARWLEDTYTAAAPYQEARDMADQAHAAEKERIYVEYQAARKQADADYQRNLETIRSEQAGLLWERLALLDGAYPLPPQKAALSFLQSPARERLEKILMQNTSLTQCEVSGLINYLYEIRLLQEPPANAPEENTPPGPPPHEAMPVE